MGGRRRYLLQRRLSLFSDSHVCKQAANADVAAAAAVAETETGRSS